MLPDGVEEILPPLSWRLEGLRRRLLDHYRERGYELVLPPLLEHRSALLSGAGAALERQLFTLTDPTGGGLLGLRADMTPQAARIAARHYPDAVARLCYLGTVLRAIPDAPGGPRAPLQVGCELFGEPGIEGDLEILRLMLRTLSLAGLGEIHLDVGHVGIYRAVAARLGLGTEDEAAVFAIVQRKSMPDLRAFADGRGIAAGSHALLARLMALHGEVDDVINRAAGELSILPELAPKLAALRHVTAMLRAEAPEVTLHIDLAELRGYRYHSGLVFAAYVDGFGREIARAGRYDETEVDGCSRSATGFSAELYELLRLGSYDG
jgi:ATP phosphoribosyltransferase regulatory subunit